MGIPIFNGRPAEDFHALPDQRKCNEERRPGGDFPPLPARPPRGGGNRRGGGFRPIGDLPAGGEPVARAEGGSAPVVGGGCKRLAALTST